MKKILVILLACLLLIGCQKKPLNEEQQFIKDYGLSCREDDIAIRNIKDEKDLLEQVTNGTHMVLLAHPDDELKTLAGTLATSSAHFASMYIYYYDRELVDEQLAKKIYQQGTPYFEEGYLEGEPLAVFFVKQGEVTDVWVYSELASLDEAAVTEKVNDTLEEILRDLAPGCNEC